MRGMGSLAEEGLALMEQLICEKCENRTFFIYKVYFRDRDAFYSLCAECGTVHGGA
jgi:hypothetical protein